jgi:hypothetical protein
LSEVARAGGRHLYVDHVRVQHTQL